MELAYRIISLGWGAILLYLIIGAYLAYRNVIRKLG